MNKTVENMDDVAPSVLVRRGSHVHAWLRGPEGAPVTAFTHGAGMDCRMFDAQVTALSPHYRVLTWDVPGHGLSQPLGDAFSVQNAAYDLLALLELYKINEAVLVGQSLGGYIVQELAFLHPERVRALVVIGSTPMTQKLSRADRWSLAGTLPLIRYWPPGHFRRTAARNTAVTPEVQAYAEGALERVSHRDFLKIWGAVSSGLHHEPGYRFGKPLLLTHGEHDGLGNIKKDASGWHAREPQSEYVVVPKAGHNANQDNPEFFNEALRAFLGRHAGVRPYLPGSV